MRYSSVLFVVFITFIIEGNAQIFTEDIKVEDVLSIESIYLKGPHHPPITGEIEHREIFEIRIPENTMYLVYGYTTAYGVNKPQSLNLKSQITDLVKLKEIIDAAIFNDIVIPEGTVELNLYLLDQLNRDKFLEFYKFMIGDYRYFTEGSIFEMNEGLVIMDELPKESVFLVIDYPKDTRSVTANLEVVAVTDTYSEKLEIRQRRALKLAETAESMIANQDYSKAFDYSTRSFILYELGWVQANIGLTELALNNPDKALETYKEALELIIRQPNEDFILEKLDKDLQRLKTTLGAVNGIEPIENLIAIFRE